MLSGVLGVAIGALIFLAAVWISASIPRLVQDTVGVTIVLSVLLLLALAEIPMMLLGLWQMARSGTTPRGLLLGTFLVYVAFASVYAAIFVLVTGQTVWGGMLAALMLARFVSGVLLK